MRLKAPIRYSPIASKHDQGRKVKAPTSSSGGQAIMQMAVYAGFPAALNGLFAAKEVFAQHADPAPQA